jgi:hypothetical protein
LTAYAAHPEARNSDAIKKNPRLIPAIVAVDKTLPPRVRDRILRAESAMINGYDNLGFFAVAVCVGNAARLDVSLLNWLAAV